jgi:hypothetical protein
LRVLIVGRSKPASVETGLARALRRLGHTAAQVDDRKLRQRIGRAWGSRWLRLRARIFRPDHILFFKPHDVEVSAFEALRERARVTMWYRDLTPPPDPHLDALVARALHAHRVFLTAGGQVNVWSARGVKHPGWLPNAADRDFDKPVPPDPRFACDVAFIGRGVWPGPDYSRAEFLTRIAVKFRVRVWGQEWHRWAHELNWDGSTAYGEDFARVCASAKIVLDIQPALWAKVNDQLYSSNRMVRVMACGGFCLSQGAPALQRLFHEGEHCAWYQTDDEAFAQIEKYIANDPLREHVRAAGRDFVQRHHMLDHRVDNLLTGKPYINPLDVR